MNSKKLIIGIGFGVMISIIWLIAIAIIYKATNRTPEGIEAALVTWAGTIVSLLCGIISIAAED